MEDLMQLIFATVILVGMLSAHRPAVAFEHGGIVSSPTEGSAEPEPSTGPYNPSPSDEN